MHRHALDARIAIAQRRPDGGSGRRQRQAHRGPQRPLTHVDGRMAGDGARQRRQRAIRTEADQRLDGAAPHGRPRIGEAADQRRRRRLPPVETTPARVGHRRRAALPHAVDRARHVRLGQLRRRATQLVPGAGVDDEQAAVGVLDDVGRVEVERVGDDEVGVLAGEGRAGRHQLVARHLLHVEERGVEGLAARLAEAGAGRARRVPTAPPARGGRPAPADRRSAGARR